MINEAMLSAALFGARDHTANGQENSCSVEEEKMKIQRQIEELKKRLDELNNEKKLAQALPNTMNSNALIQIQPQPIKVVQQVSVAKSEVEFFVKSENGESSGVEIAQKGNMKTEPAKASTASKKKSQQKINQMDGFNKTIQQQLSDGGKINKQQQQQQQQQSNQNSTQNQNQNQQFGKQASTIMSVPSSVGSNAIIAAAAPVQEFSQMQNSALTQ